MAPYQRDAANPRPSGSVCLSRVHLLRLRFSWALAADRGVREIIFHFAHFFFDKPKAVWDISPVMKTKYTYFLHVYPKAGHRILDNRPARPFRRATQKSKAEANADTLVFSTPAVDHIVLEKCDEEGEFIETLWRREASTFPSFRNE